MTIPPKRPSPSVPPPTSGTNSRPPGPGGNTPSRPPPSVLPSQRPSSLKDALTEARAISGGNLGRPSTAPTSMRPAGKKTILIVDDDAAMRTKLRAGLEPYYEILEAKDGMEAVELASKIQPPAMIISDIVMPRVDGFTLAKIMRGNPIMKKVPIMFVSSRNSPADVTQALVIGVSQYMLKSVPIGEIVAKVRKIVN